MKTKLILILILLTSSIGYSQDSFDCKSILKKALKKYEKLKNPEKDKIYYMNAEMKSVYKTKSKIPSTHVKMEMYLKKNKAFYESNYFSYYVDKKDAFFILQPRKQVVREEGGKEMNRDKEFDKVIGFQDSLVNTSSITSCEAIEGETNLVKIVLKPNKSVQENLHVKRLVYHMNSKNHKIKKSVIFYDEDYPILKQVIVYNKLDYNYTKKKLGSAYDKVLNANGELKAPYKDYELIDNRKTE